MRLDARVGEADEPEAWLEPELGRRRLGGEQRRGRAVRQPGRVARGDAPTGAEGRTQRREALDGRLRPQELVALGALPALLGEDAHRDDGARVHAVRVVPRGCGSPLRLGGVAVGVLAGQAWQLVVEVLRRLAHHGGALVDQPVGDEARVEVDVVAHRVVAHVLDAAGDRQVARPHRDLAGRRGDRRQRAGAHPVDREPGHGVGQAREERDVPAERQALVADLRGRRHDDVADPLGRCLGVAAQELTDGLDGHVVGARLPEETTLARLAEGRADAVDVDDLAELPCPSRGGYRELTDRSISSGTEAHRLAPRFLDTRNVDWEVKRAWASREHEHRAAAPLEGREDFRLAGDRRGRPGLRGLASLMLGDEASGAEWLRRAADEYETSWRAAPRRELGAGRSPSSAVASWQATARVLASAAEAALEEGALAPRGRSAATARRSRCSSSAGTTRRRRSRRGSSPRASSPGCGGRRARSARRPRRGRLRRGAPGGAALVRGARGVPRGRCGRGHRARAGRARDGREACRSSSSLGAAARDGDAAEAHVPSLSPARRRAPWRAFIAAWIALRNAARTPADSSSRIAAIVVPPGEVTISRSSTGCIFSSRSCFAVPSIVWTTSCVEISRESPSRSPASIIASARRAKYAGPEPETAVTASIARSGTRTTAPRCASVSSASVRCSSPACAPAQIPAIPSCTVDGVFGIARTTGTSEER